MTDRSYRIGVLPGDGTGPEVVREGLKVLEAVRRAEGFQAELVQFDLGGDRYLRTGDVLPDDELARLGEMDVLFLGAVGDPRIKPGILERDLLLRIRFELDDGVRLRAEVGIGQPDVIGQSGIVRVVDRDHGHSGTVQVVPRRAEKP